MSPFLHGKTDGTGSGYETLFISTGSFKDGLSGEGRMALIVHVTLEKIY
jgi:uncharacterized protein (AIM24 family)